jgi:hypothetical protein
MGDHTDKIVPQEEWRALVAAFGTMRDALGAQTVPALLRFGCDAHLVRAVAAVWRREHDAGEEPR